MLNNACISNCCSPIEDAYGNFKWYDIHGRPLSLCREYDPLNKWCHQDKSPRILLYVIIGASILLVFLIIFLCFAYFKRKKQKLNLEKKLLDAVANFENADDH